MFSRELSWLAHFKYDLVLSLLEEKANHMKKKELSSPLMYIIYMKKNTTEWFL